MADPLAPALCRFFTNSQPELDHAVLAQGAWARTLRFQAWVRWRGATSSEENPKGGHLDDEEIFLPG
jgi:hypothetical protein